MASVPEQTRDAVRLRANDRCEYCRVPNGYSIVAHQVDHVIPIKHRGSSKLDNLAWACFNCNNTKGTDISGYDLETNILTPLFNPRLELWDEHFKNEGAFIIGETAVGRVTIQVFNLNQENRVVFRNELIQDGLY